MSNISDIFNSAGGIGEDAPVWCDIPTPWGRTLTIGEGDDDAPNDPVAQAVEDYERLMEGLDGMREAFDGYAMLGEEFEQYRERQREEKARQEAAQREAFERELAEASILQQPLRVSRPVSLRQRFFN